MSDLSRAWNIENLRRAWQWIRSNPDRAYKGYFRQLYSTYATADEALLCNLRNRLTRRVFVPSNAGKVFFPKPSGILRPYTLLAIEDQIVYQAMANIVAEHLLPHVRSRYNKQVFGHQYAGTSSGWFYRKWSDGYKAFNTAAEDAFKNGYSWAASFDLTAFYDSIDHNVLRHMLGEIGLDQDFQKCLTDFLAQWTATSTQIYHNHGIPQGPLSSGLIAEVVLRHFDNQRLSGSDVKYFRYVDDIRLFAKKEEHLRYALVALDRISKDVGLFPQSGKIDIHLVKDISDELKSVSNPIEPALSTPAIDQKALRKRIVELTKRDFRVTNPTRFKYLLAKASPSAMLMDRMWRIYERAPHYYPQVAGHLSKFDEIPERHANRLVVEIEAQELYPAIRAALIEASVGRIPSSVLPKAKTVLKKLWHPKHAQIDLSDSLWRWLCREKHLTNAQMRYGFKSQLSPWLQMRLHFGMRWSDATQDQRGAWLNHTMRSKHADVALSAAWLCGMYGVTPEKPTKDINPLAKLMLKELGLMRRGDSSVCGVRMAISEMTGHDIPIRWKKFFGKSYKRAEAQITTCKGYFKTDPSAWVNAIDVFNDLLLDTLYRHDTALGTYTLGKIGSVLKSTRLKADYPAISRLANQLHEKRLESDLSHAKVKATNKPTKPIRFKWLRSGARLLQRGARELETKGY
jgi:hypothetical protein